MFVHLTFPKWTKRIYNGKRLQKQTSPASHTEPRFLPSVNSVTDTPSGRLLHSCLDSLWDQSLFSFSAHPLQLIWLSAQQIISFHSLLKWKLSPHIQFIQPSLQGPVWTLPASCSTFFSIFGSSHTHLFVSWTQNTPSVLGLHACYSQCPVPPDLHKVNSFGRSFKSKLKWYILLFITVFETVMFA